MNNVLNKTLIISGLALSALAPAYAADHGKEKKPIQAAEQFVDDSVITTKVKAKHAQDDVVSVLGVSVDTKHGVVILTGKAKTEAEKSRAEMLAKQVEGVKDVSNNIEVKPKS
jgi:hyperosmotically inducible periplasmic protein